MKMDDGFTLQHTGQCICWFVVFLQSLKYLHIQLDMGRLMARYCVAFDSMKRFLSFKGKENLAEFVS